MDKATERRAETRSVSQLLRDLSEETATLVREEVQLARTEMMEKTKVYARNAVYVAAGAFVAYAALLTLLAAASYGLGVALWNVLPLSVVLWLSPLIVGVIVGVVGYVMIHKGLRTMKQEGLVPHKTVETMRENKEWLKKEVA